MKLSRKQLCRLIETSLANPVDMNSQRDGLVGALEDLYEGDYESLFHAAIQHLTNAQLREIDIAEEYLEG
jgi:hypothetical protein